MRHRAFRSGRTYIGYAPAPSNDIREQEDRTLPDVHLGGEVDEERTLRSFFLVSGGSARETGRAVLTADMVAELRRRLREAEALEASGVRLRPEALDDDDLELDIEVEEPPIEELEAIVSPVPTLEVALAPNSDSNFYAGFDEDHPTGIFVATYSRLPVGAPAYLDVHLPGGHRFRTAAIVEWIRPPEAAAPGTPAGLGFAMGGLDDEARRLIRRFVRHRKPLFYEA
ncbi:MAG TPA: hypothetical protein VIL20_08865 [Sandaracinaceae bacterium]